MKVKMLSFTFMLAISVNLFAQNRGLQIQHNTGLDSAVGKQWAVFIAIDHYREWTPLSNPVKDAKEIRDILLEDYYIDEVRELYDLDATAAGIRQLLFNLRTQVGMDDSVFVFYAGHGYTDPNTNTGFWIPSDAGQDQMRQSNWLPNIQVRNMLAQLAAMHVFLISDACFSGDILDLTRGAGPAIDSESLRRAYSLVSRQVLTSGSSEEVPDSSEFAMRLKSALRRNENTCIDPYGLFTIVREVQRTQPLLGSIPGSEHREGGSFLFFRKQAATNVPPPPPPPPGSGVTIATGTITVESQIAGELLIDGKAAGITIKDGGFATIPGVAAGNTEVAVKEANGTIIRAQNMVRVLQGQTVAAVIERPAPANMVRNLRSGIVGADKVSLLWDSTGSGLSYKIYYHTQNDSANAIIKTTNSTSTEMTNLTSNTTYYFWVSTVQDGRESDKSPVLSVRTIVAYLIGRPGPGGGIIFYDKGSITNGWRYLEAAPSNTEFRSVLWGANGYDISGTSTAVGSGKQNTQSIVNRLSQLRETGRAAQICTSLNFGGFSDWFLPSRDELDLMYKNLKQKGLGGFQNNKYWSSSQTSNAYAIGQNFTDGSQSSNNAKNLAFFVRAIRAF